MVRACWGVLWTIRCVNSAAPVHHWDIFCRVIDNHGDLGVCWRLSTDLAQRGHTVRLWVDDARGLAWMAPQGAPGVSVHAWPDAASAYPDCAQAVIEAFGCELPDFVQARIAQAQALARPPVWINLEYLSAEAYVRRQHGLPSPVMSGPAQGCTKWFFFPGFTADTGGLLREADLSERQARWQPEAWLGPLGLPLRPEAMRVSLFCYEPEALASWLRTLAHAPRPVDVLVTPGRAWQAVQGALTALGSDAPALQRVRVHALPWLSQRDFDHLLWSCDLNAVRGEDSLVRALWAARPLLWQLYPQHDDAHHDKLRAFAQCTGMPADLLAWHAHWNGLPQAPTPLHERLDLAWPAPDAWRQWQDWAGAVRDRLAHGPSLSERLIAFVGAPDRALRQKS